MPVITLLTDCSNNDYYAAAVKGHLMTNCPDVNIVDIDNSIQQHNIESGAYALKSCYRYFPDNTIHIIGVGSVINKNSSHYAAFHNKQYFIGADNGLLDMVFDTSKAMVVKIDSQTNNNFPELEVFAPAALKIIETGNILAVGNKNIKLKKVLKVEPIVESDYILGHIEYIDTYNNAIINVDKQLFENTAKGRDFRIFVNSKHYSIDKISANYNDVPDGELVAIFNNNNMLELAMNRAEISTMFSLETGKTVRIEFINSNRDNDKGTKLF